MIILTILFITLIIIAFLKVASSKIQLQQFDIKLTLPLKGVLALLIMMHHLSYKFPEDSFFAHEFGMWGALVCAMFFFLSGYGLQISLLNKGRSYLDGFLKKRFFRLLFPLIVATAIFQILLVLEGTFSWDKILSHATRGVPPLPNSWYVYAAAFTYMMFWLICRFIKKTTWQIFAMWGAILVFVLIVNKLHWPSYWTASIGAMPLGQIYASNEERIQIMITNHRNIVLSVASVVGLMVCIYSLIGIYVRHVPGWGPLTYMSMPIVIPTLLLYVGMYKGRYINFLGTISYEIYIVHGAIIYFFCHWIESPLVLVSIVLPLSVIAAYLLKKTSCL